MADIKVGIIMGSQSDWPTMKEAANILDELGVAYETRIVSAHRTPDRLWDYGKTAADRGLHVIIAACRRCCAFAGHDGLQDPCAGGGRASADARALWCRQPLFHCADAQGLSSGNHGDRRCRGRQCGPDGRRNTRHRRCRPCRPARCLARRPCRFHSRGAYR